MTEKNNATPNDTINLSILWHNFVVALKHLLWLPILLALLGGGVQFLRCQRPKEYTYSCRAVFAVSANYASSTDILSYNYYYDNAAAKQLSATFPYVLGSDAMKLLIGQKMGVEEIPGKIEASSITNAGLFVLTVTSETPENALAVIEAVIDVYPQAATAVLGDTQLSIIDKPVLPTEPNEHYSLLMPMAKGAALGLGIGLVLLFLLSLCRKTVHAAADLHKLTNLPCMAYLPAVAKKARTKKNHGGVTILNEHISDDFTESVRALRLKLTRLHKQDGCMTVMVTSTLAGEGKSTVSANLALALAAEGKRVVLLDADLRKQNLKQVLGVVQSSDGLPELLSRKSSKLRPVSIPNSTLMLVSGDSTNDRPQRLLDSTRMAQIMDALKQQMDYIIIDTPPAGLLSDAATIAKFTDGCIYVVRQDTASTTQIYDSIQTLAAAEVNLLGCVLNGTKEGTTRYGYGNKYSQEYGYSNPYGSKYASGYAERVSK